MEKKTPLTQLPIHTPNILRWVATAALIWLGAVFAERSWGQEFDTTPPMPGLVDDVIGYGDGTFSADVDTVIVDNTPVFASWYGFFDDAGTGSFPGMPGMDGIQYYEYGVTTTGNCMDSPIPAGASVGPVTSMPMVGIPIGPQGTFYYNCVRAFDMAGNASPWAMSDGVMLIRSPETWITSHPSYLSTETAAAFEFSASDPSHAFECELDGGAFMPCLSGQSYEGLGEGTHLFRVRATDPVVGPDPSPAEVYWNIDHTPPDTQVTSGPSSPTSSTHPVFGVSSTESGSTFECELDGGGSAFAPCVTGKSYSGVSEGQHVFRVRSKDETGNIDLTPAEHRWMVDLTPPYFSGMETPVPVSQSRIDLFWTPASDNVTPMADTLFEICMSIAPGVCTASFWTYQSVVGDTMLSVNDLMPGKAYYFAARAVDQAGNRSAVSTEKRVITLRAPGGPDIAAGGYHSCALLADGSVKCWGYNNYGQLGNGLAGTRTTPVAVSSLTNATAVSAGWYHTCALIADGTARCWGSNSAGRLGDGTSNTRRTPVQVQGLANIRSMSAGNAHTCAVRAEGSAQCWGSNTYGQLGNGTTVSSSVPVTVSGLSNVRQVSGGMSHTCAVLSNGMVECWGRNLNGQLGDGTTTPSALPVPVVGLMDAVAVTVGYSHSCALRSDGTALCWGTGHLGDGATRRSSTPVIVSDSEPFVAISTPSSSYHTCVSASEGQAKCWGYNTKGQLGDGTTTDRNLPTAVTGLSNAAMISTGGILSLGHSCAVTKDGLFKCWGYNSYGQLGDGTSTNRSTPVSVVGLP